ncbi:hypothetical protein [Psychroflexus tropicus]|uniref:hypothetical protein n=1 Tax=Psychroflexus tropicus TaxID=197345 RepID=UPI00037E66D0|nr:hypothetical protein [Psychroflexus tropicus]
MKKSILVLAMIIPFAFMGCSSDDDNNNEEMTNPTLNVGDIIISEIMNNPLAVPDSVGE